MKQLTWRVVDHTIKNIMNFQICKKRFTFKKPCSQP